MLVLFIYTSSLASPLTTAGNIGQFALPITALLAIINAHDKEGAYQFTKVYLSTLGVVYAVKPTINRQRPDGGEWSFPSGHSASAFAGAGFLQQRYGWSYGIPAYLLAGIVGYSRIAAKRHWTSDVVAGGAIGIGANLVFTTKYHQIRVEPIIDSTQVGLHTEIAW